MKEDGFTLVELLAVVVILAIILVISIPKILDVIDQSKTESIKSSVKLIADNGEKEYSRRILTESLDQENNPIECLDLNSADYDTCSISFNSNGIATVSLTGKGKFSGYTCKGTKDSVRCAENGEVLTTDESCFAVEESSIYTIKNYDSCVSYLTVIFEGAPSEDIQTICNGEVFQNMTTTAFFSKYIGYGAFTEQELLDNNVIEKVINGLSITGYSNTCEKDVVIPDKINEVTVTKISDVAFTTCGAEVSNLSSSNEIGNVMFLNYSNDKEINPTFIVTPMCVGLGITSVVIPNTITSIGESAFSYNSLTSLIIPSSVTYIGLSAFSDNSLTSVTFPTTPLTVECGAFHDNEGLDLVYPNNVTVIACPLVQ